MPQIQIEGSVKPLDKTGIDIARSMDAARKQLRLAQLHLEAVPAGQYKEIVRQGIENALTGSGQAALATDSG